eukprot:361296-Pelagomonas_calceolata.AAC.5
MRKVGNKSKGRMQAGAWEAVLGLDIALHSKPAEKKQHTNSSKRRWQLGAWEAAVGFNSSRPSKRNAKEKMEKAHGKQCAFPISACTALLSCPSKPQPCEEE